MAALVSVVFLGWLGSIPLAAYVSHQRGRGLFEGLVLGLFYGPLGVIAAGLLPESRPEPIVRRVAANTAQQKTPASR